MSFTSDCLEHAGHLVSLGGFKIVDEILRRFGRKWKLFSSVATCSHTLRDLSKDFYLEWCRIHGDLSGLKKAKKLFPKVVGGRWNSCSEALTRMRQMGGQSMLQPVLCAILPAKGDQEEGQLQTQGENTENDKSRPCVDEISFEETKQYQAKMGRWRRRTKEVVDDPLWWIVSDIMRIAQLTIVHFSESHSHWQTFSSFPP